MTITFDELDVIIYVYSWLSYFFLQLSDFNPVMKLFDLLYPEKQVGSQSLSC